MTPAQLRIKEWRENPRRFVWDNFKVEPDAWQGEVLDAFASSDPLKSRISMQACSGPGKSAVLAWCGWNFLSCYGRPGHHPKAAVVAITADTLKDGLWAEFAKWQSFSQYLSGCFKWTKERIFAVDHPETWFASARSFPKTADAEEQGRTLSGLHSDYILYLMDESGDMSVNVLKSAEQGLSTGPVFGKILQAGNPTSMTGMLYAAATTLREQWFVVVITGDPEDPRRSKRIDINWATEQIKLYGRDNPWVKSFILGQFPPGSINALFTVEEVQDSMNRVIPEQDYSWAQKRIGVDCARFGDDATCLFPRQGLQAFEPVIMRNADTIQIASRVALAKANWNSEMEFIDGTGGFGAGVVDQLRVAGHSPMEIHFSAKASNDRYLNKRAEMWFLMNEWVKRGGAMPKNATLLKELTAPTYTFHNGKFQLEPKEQIKKRLGFSPDCFIAGTMVSTPQGLRPIEDIKEGDLVSTPVGPRTVIKTWVSDATELTTATFSNGQSLTGKGAHRVFTWDKGWVRLDGLSMVNEIESDSQWNKIKWNLRRLLFTRTRRFGFKLQADIIPTTGERLAYLDFFTGAFGSTLMAPFQRVTTSIIKMATGLIMNCQTLSASLLEPTTSNICESEWLTKTPRRDTQRYSRPRLSQKLGSGMVLLRALSGIMKTEKNNGKQGSHLEQSHALSVENKKSPTSLQELSSVQHPVRTAWPFKKIKQLLEPAHSALKSLFITSTGFRLTALGSVQTGPTSVKTYNLTLDRDNIYYANGILVENCADALALTFAFPDEPSGNSLLSVLKRSRDKGQGVGDFGEYNPYDDSRT